MPRYLAANTFQSTEATNTTTTFTIGAFPTPQAGNFLLLMASAGVTMTTPTGWTLVTSTVAANGLYLWSKTAAGTETSYTTTTNGTGYSLAAAQYEFPAGSTIGTSANSGAATVASNAANASVTPTAGQTVLALANWDYSLGALTPPVVWSGVTNLYKGVEVQAPRGTKNGAWISTGFVDYAPAAATAPIGTPSGTTATNKQDITATINVNAVTLAPSRPRNRARFRASLW
jgi:hypothetical protein